MSEAIFIVEIFRRNLFGALSAQIFNRARIA
jgi:hypothetical protein